MDPLACLRPDEEISVKLRALFESYGYRRTNVPEFEEYDFYVGYRGFVSAERMITFMDATGRSMALRPDVTLSIIKNTAPKPGFVAQKLYYAESVYRFGRENSEYYRVNQVGVEAIGGDAAFQNSEVIALALSSLSAIHPSYCLTLSHMGFVSGLMDSFSLSPEKEEEAYALLHKKNRHDLELLLRKAGVEEPFRNRIAALNNLPSSMKEGLRMAKNLVINQKMETALAELELLYAHLGKGGFDGALKKVRLDFSAVSDLDYYNGLIFKGYIEGIPHSLLSGGRYDNLMKALQKEQGGIGFAVSLNDMNRHFAKQSPFDVERVLYYPKNADLGMVLFAVRKSQEETGGRVRAEQVESRESLPYRAKEEQWMEGGKSLC